MFKIKTFVAICCLFTQIQISLAQLTIKVTSIPNNTPAGSTIYAVGTFNNWAPADPTKKLSLNSDGSYSIVLTPPAGQVKMKFTRGSWATVEGDANGNFLPDRVFNYTGAPTTLTLSILSWEDQGSGTGGGSTAASNVQLLDDNFYIPQLNRTRRIWLYLPPDYYTTTKHYPVLYMHDAQNLFDEATSFSGEWEVDETLNQLHQSGNFGCIVVGIENGGAYRLDEYSPWVNPSYGGGQGDEYTEFITNTLKPHIDGNFRTLPGRLTTGIMGSSMGGLISMYALSERQDVFSKAGIFSPAFWFADQNSANHVATHPKQGEVRTYFLAGGDEPQYVEDDMTDVADAMLTAGFGVNEIYFTVPTDGQHSEWFWAREFKDAYLWLFDGVSDAQNLANENLSGVELFPNPTGNTLRFTGFPATKSLNVRIFNPNGTLYRDSSVRLNEALTVADLPKGVYFVKIEVPGMGSNLLRFVKQ
jgi:predicted alpha/beta superfamily hydrolase